MKNLFFALAFMLVGTFAFGNSNKSIDENILKSADFEIEFLQGNEKMKISQFFDKLKDCKITVKGTIDGKEVNITVTLEADDCVDAAIRVLKGVIKDLNN